MTAGVRGSHDPAPDLFTSVLSNFAAGVLMADRDGVITFANAAWEWVDEAEERLAVKALPLAIVLRERREVVNAQRG